MVRHGGIGSRRQLSRQGGGRQRQNNSSHSARRRERAGGTSRVRRRRNNENDVDNVDNGDSSADVAVDTNNNNNGPHLRLLVNTNNTVQNSNSYDESPVANQSNQPNENRRPSNANYQSNATAANDFSIDDNGFLVFAANQDPGAANQSNVNEPIHNANQPSTTAANKNSADESEDGINNALGEVGINIVPREDESSEEEVVENPTRNAFDAFVDVDEDSSSSSSSESEIDERDNNIGSSPEQQELLRSLLLLYDNESTSTDNQSDSSDDDDDDIARCAICFLKDGPTDNWRRLMTLPCCGNNGREETSSTRFCAACMLHLAHGVRPGQIADDEYPHYFLHELDGLARNFYGENDCQTLTTRFIHCPRCKDICVVDIKDPVTRLNVDWTKPTNANSITLRRPKFKEKCQFVGKKIGIALK